MEGTGSQQSRALDIGSSAALLHNLIPMPGVSAETVGSKVLFLGTVTLPRRTGGFHDSLE
jgi:hypothetical protein